MEWEVAVHQIYGERKQLAELTSDEPMTELRDMRCLSCMFVLTNWRRSLIPAWRQRELKKTMATMIIGIGLKRLFECS